MGDSRESSDGYGEKGGLEPFPSDEPYRHQILLWHESAKVQLAPMGLLQVAEGSLPATASLLTIVDLSAFPAAVPGTPDYMRVFMARRKIEEENRVNAARKRIITMQAYTKLYMMLAAACEKTAPATFRRMQQLCEMRVLYPSMPELHCYYDGPRAWRLLNDKMSVTRTRNDRDFYRKAEDIQRAHQLPNGCPATGFIAKAHAFILWIMPNLAQPYTPVGAVEYILELLPRSLKADARRLQRELEAEGRHGDLYYVTEKARTVVFDEQRFATLNPTLVDESEIKPFSIKDLSTTTGMNLKLKGGGMAASSTPAGATSGNGTKKWCPRCPHFNMFTKKPLVCFQCPTWTGPWPPSIDQNDSKRAELEDGRRANARTEGITYAPAKRASAEAVTRWKASKKKKPANSAIDATGDDDDDAVDDAGGVVMDAETREWLSALEDVSLMVIPGGGETAMTIDEEMTIAAGDLDGDATLECLECLEDMPDLSAAVDPEPPSEETSVPSIDSAELSASAGYEADEEELPNVSCVMAGDRLSNPLIVSPSPFKQTTNAMDDAPPPTQLNELYPDLASPGVVAHTIVHGGGYAPSDETQVKPSHGNLPPPTPVVGLGNEVLLPPSLGENSAAGGVGNAVTELASAGEMPPSGGVVTPDGGLTTPPSKNSLPVDAGRPISVNEATPPTVAMGDATLAPSTADPAALHRHAREAPWAACAGIVAAMMACKVPIGKSLLVALCVAFPMSLAISILENPAAMSVVSKGLEHAATVWTFIRRSLTFLIQTIFLYRTAATLAVIVALFLGGAHGMPIAHAPLRAGSLTPIAGRHASVPFCPSLDAPRDDLLTVNEAHQLHVELLAGHKPPRGTPKGFNELVIVDSGCATSMGNRREQFDGGSIREATRALNGAHGGFSTRFKGDFRYPIDTDDHHR